MMVKNLLFVVVVVLAAAAGWYGLSHLPRQQALGQVAESFKDPASVQFSDVVFTDNAICGWANAKNSFGAYAGKEPFIAGRGGFGLQRFDVTPQPGDTVDSLTARQEAWFERHRACTYQ